MTNKEIGKEFGISSSAVGKAASDVERFMEEDGRIRDSIKGLISRFRV